MEGMKPRLWRPLVLAVLALLVIGAVVVRLGGGGDDVELEARLARAESRTEDLQREVTDLEAAGERQTAELNVAGAPFAPEFLVAMEQVRTAVVDGACGIGRSSAREGQPVPAADGVVELVLGEAETAHPALVTVEDWRTLLDGEAANGEARRCHSDETAVIQEEQRVAEEARLTAEAEERAAEEREYQGRVDGCASGDPLDCSHLGTDDLERLCNEGASEACFQLNGPLTPEEVEEKIEGAECRWRGDGTGYFWNLDTGEELFASPDFNPCA